MVRIFYDAEFTGLTKDTDLISIGLVSDSGAYFYAEFNDYDKSKVGGWLQEHVIDNLRFNNYEFRISPLDDRYTFVDHDTYHWNIEMKAGSNEIKERLLNWLQNECRGDDEDPRVQIYCDCYAYDWILFNDLITGGGSALDIPDFIYYIPMDLSTCLQMHDEDPDINREEFIGKSLVDLILGTSPFSDWNNNGDIKHNSLWDAFVTKFAFMFLFREINRNRRVYPIETVREAVEKFNAGKDTSVFYAEMNHPQ